MTTTPEPTKGVPRHEGNSTFTPRGDFNSLADWILANVNGTVPNFGSLPATGNWFGRTLIVESSDIEYRWNGSAWRVWNQGRQLYTPTINNLTLGNGTRTGAFGVASGRVWVSASVTLGSTSVVTGDMSLSVPWTRDTTVHPNGDAIEGKVHFVDSSSGTRLTGELVGVTAAVALRATLVTGSSNVSVIATAAGTPFTWATGDTIWCNFSYATSQ